MKETTIDYKGFRITKSSIETNNIFENKITVNLISVYHPDGNLITAMTNKTISDAKVMIQAIIDFETITIEL